tara:strand:- start:21 stop:287 length:267 start_codon:yes stop_codon:yes gene_type:complete
MENYQASKEKIQELLAIPNRIWGGFCHALNTPTNTGMLIVCAFFVGTGMACTFGVSVNLNEKIEDLQDKVDSLELRHYDLLEFLLLSD